MTSENGSTGSLENRGESFTQQRPVSSALRRNCIEPLFSPFSTGGRRPGDPDGPVEYHVILLDNGRTSVLADEVGRQALRCIRCSACLNVCPVYERTGGHAYGSVYPGPIGAVLNPLLRGTSSEVDRSLPYASSLCGSCTDVCPVKIDLLHQLLAWRGELAADYALTKAVTVKSLAGRTWAENGRSRTYWSLGAQAKQIEAHNKFVDKLTDVLTAPAWPEHDASLNDWIVALSAGVNDLEAPASQVQPAVAEVLKALTACDGARLADEWQ